jgi:hypothetical protein
MARGFDGADTDRLTATITGTAAGAFTLGAWVYPTNDNGGSVIEISDGSGRVHRLAMYLDFSLRMLVESRRSAGNGFISEVCGHFNFSLNNWYFIVGTFSGVDSQSAGHVYKGDVSNAVANIDDANTGGSGSGLDSGATGLHIGNVTADNSSFYGRIFAPFMVPWVMTTADMDQVRTGDTCGLTDGGTPAFFFGLEGTALTSYSGIGPSYTLTNTGASSQTDPITLTPCGGAAATSLAPLTIGVARRRMLTQ